MRMPEAGPFGDTRFDARLLAIVAASVVKSPAGGCVESLVTDATQRSVFRSGTAASGHRLLDVPPRGSTLTRSSRALRSGDRVSAARSPSGRRRAEA